MSTKQTTTDTITLVESGGNAFICGASAAFGAAILDVTKDAALPLAITLLEFAGWQPMEAAPMDGTLILAQRDRGDPVTAFYDDSPGTDWWCMTTGERMGGKELTGWLPLPKAESEQ